MNIRHAIRPLLVKLVSTSQRPVVHPVSTGRVPDSSHVINLHEDGDCTRLEGRRRYL